MSSRCAVTYESILVGGRAGVIALDECGQYEPIVGRVGVEKPVEQASQIFFLVNNEQAFIVNNHSHFFLTRCT